MGLLHSTSYARSDLEAFRLRQACSQNRAESYNYAGSDFPPPIRFRSAKEDPGHACKTGPNPIWTAWSGFSQTHPVRKQVGVQGAYGSVPAECNRPATNFPLSDSVAFFTDGPDNIVQNQPKIDLVPDDCVRFWSNESGTEASLEMTHSTGAHNYEINASSGVGLPRMRESSGPLPANASDPIRIKCESDPACLLGYSCHCEALRVHFQMTRSTSVHIKQIIIGRSLSLPVSRFGLAVRR